MRTMKIAAQSDIGKHREINEDSYFVYRNDNLVGGFVADGMGGHQAGEIASSMVADIVKDYIISEFNTKMDYVETGEMIRCAFLTANEQIYRYAKKNEKLEGMGTTASLAIIYQGKLIVAHVGDSRVYMIGEDIRQITHDHSFVEELLRRGEITRQDASTHPNRNFITRAVGAEDTIKVDITITAYHGETVLLCSDGLTNMVSDEQIREIIQENEDLQEAADKLIALANKKGGKDNITVVAFCK